jgi:hypothetical protein
VSTASTGVAPLQLTIDLGLEIKNITQKQHLNDVHFAVQLVRHALRHGAPEVRITSTRRTFTLEHDGAPLNAGERDLVFALLGQSAASERQEAMTQLEKHHGVALLSLLVTEARVDVLSDVSFAAIGGRLTRIAEQRSRGYRITVHRTRRSLREERRELAFYCRCSDVPVRFNRRPLPREPVGHSATDVPLLAMAFKALAGHGMVGITPSGMMSRTRYYKHGVYFGVRQHVPSDNLPLEAAYNATTSSFEENFRVSVKAAGTAIRAGRDALLDHVPERYGALPRADRDRVRSVLLGMAERRWTEALRRVPLFDTGAMPAALSVHDLAAAGERHGFVTWVPREEAPRAGARARLPILEESDLSALTRLLAHPLRRALPAVLRVVSTTRPASDQDVALPPDACPAPVQRLLRALAELSQDPTFVVTTGTSRCVDETPAGRVICIPLADPVLKRSAETYAAQPGRLDLIRAALLA